MGLVKAVTGSVIGTALETWKDYFICDSLDNDTLMVKGTKRGNGGSGEVITNGSGIVVNDGQCALVIENGNILEVAAEPGNYTFDSSLSPSVFDGGIAGIKNSFKDALERFTYGGEVNKSQRVYYVNTKEIMDNRFGTTSPIPFKVVFDQQTGAAAEISVKCNGEYTFRIVNPVVFYQKVAGNKAARYEKDELAAIMKSEILDALNPAFGELSKKGIGYSDLPTHTSELKDAMRNALKEKWEDGRGIAFESMTINSVTIPEADAERIKNYQFAIVNKDVATANATITQAAADSMRDAANNANGATNGFVGVNMAQNAASGLYQSVQPAATGGWTCPKCGTVNNGNFCTNCGTAKGAGTTCPHCGAPLVPGAKFCSNCGKEL